MTWRVVWSPRALREADRLDRPVRERVEGAVARYAETEQGDVLRLQAIRPPQFRLRVGDWRVRFARDPEQRTLYVLAVRHREGAY